MLKATKKGVVKTGEIWDLTDEDRVEIANIFNESMELSTPCRNDFRRWEERDKTPLRDTDNYKIYTRSQLEDFDDA